MGLPLAYLPSSAQAKQDDGFDQLLRTNGVTPSNGSNDSASRPPIFQRQADTFIDKANAGNSLSRITELMGAQGQANRKKLTQAEMEEERKKREIRYGQKNAFLYHSDYMTLAQHFMKQNLANAGYKDLVKEAKKIQGKIFALESKKKNGAISNDEKIKLTALKQKLSQIAAADGRITKDPKKHQLEKMKLALLNCINLNSNCDKEEARDSLIAFNLGRKLNAHYLASKLNSANMDSNHHTELSEEEEEIRRANLSAGLDMPWMQQDDEGTWATAKTTSYQWRHDRNKNDNGEKIAGEDDSDIRTFNMSRLIEDERAHRRVALLASAKDPESIKPILTEEFRRLYGTYMMTNTRLPSSKKAAKKVLVAQEEHIDESASSRYQVASINRESDNEKEVEYEIDRDALTKVQTVQAALENAAKQDSSRKLSMTETEAMEDANAVNVATIKNEKGEKEQVLVENSEYKAKKGEDSGRERFERVVKRGEKFANLSEAYELAKNKTDSEHLKDKYKTDEEFVAEMITSANEQIIAQEDKAFAEDKDARKAFSIQNDSKSFVKDIDSILPSQEEIQEHFKQSAASKQAAAASK